MKTTDELRTIAMRDFPDYLVTPTEITHILKTCEAMWAYSGNPADPHAILTAGDHSDGFVDVPKALVYPNLARLFAYQLTKSVVSAHMSAHGELPKVDWVIGSDHASAPLVHFLGEFFNAKCDFTSKEQVAGSKRQVWNRHAIGPTETVLQVEEIVTTSFTMNEVRRAIREGNPYEVMFVPFAVTLVDRSDVIDIEGSPILNLVHYDIRKWKPADCPLCRAGSKAIDSPKQNWAELTGRA